MPSADPGVLGIAPAVVNVEADQVPRIVGGCHVGTVEVVFVREQMQLSAHENGRLFPLKKEDLVFLEAPKRNFAQHHSQRVVVEAIEEADLLEQRNYFVKLVEVPARARVVVRPQVDIEIVLAHDLQLLEVAVQVDFEVQVFGVVSDIVFELFLVLRVDLTAVVLNVLLRLHDGAVRFHRLVPVVVRAVRESKCVLDVGRRRRTLNLNRFADVLHGLVGAAQLNVDEAESVERVRPLWVHVDCVRKPLF